MKSIYELTMDNLKGVGPEKFEAELEAVRDYDYENSKRMSVQERKLCLTMRLAVKKSGEQKVREVLGDPDNERKLTLEELLLEVSGAVGQGLVKQSLEDLAI